MPITVTRDLQQRVPSARLSATVPATRNRRRRRGISTLWLILTLPTFVVLLWFAFEIANLWLARVEVENALEAAALAAVKQWGDAGGGPTSVPREVGVAYAGANTVRFQPVQIATNLDENPGPDNPNENLTCTAGKADPALGIPPSGNLIFGAILEDDPECPITFNAGIAGGCFRASVFMHIEKEDSGADVDPRAFGVFFDSGPPNLSIRSISMTVPEDLHPYAYFDSTKPPVVSIEDVGADELNRYNPVVPNDVRGLNPAPTVPQSPLQNSLWTCPNPNGDICFEFEDPIEPSRFRTVTIHFADGSFTSTDDPETTDFVRFGVSFNRLKPTPPKGDNNDGDAFGRLHVPVEVTFYNSTTHATVTASGVFVDVDENGDGDFDDGRSEVWIFGPGAGQPAVRAQAIVPVRSLFCRFCGIDFGPYYVSVKTTAMYDCATGRPRLIWVDRFICPGPDP